MNKGIIYVMDCSVEGLVKIGQTGINNFNERMRNLEKNGYRNLTGLKRSFAIEVSNYRGMEVLLKDIFSSSRVGDSEIFSLDVDLAKQLLSALEGKVVYPIDEKKKQIFAHATEARQSKTIPNGEYKFFSRKYDAYMLVVNGKIKLKKGSKLAPMNEKEGSNFKKIRGSIQIDDNILTKDENCSSPSMAARIVAGHNVNGWKAWKNEPGESIDIYRKHK